MRFALIISTAMLLAACGLPDTGSPDGSSTTTTPATTTTPDVDTTVGTSMPVPRFTSTDYAIEDLSRKLKVPAEEIEVVREEAVTWSDGSLGCPESGMAYTQALVEGSKVVLAHGDRYYDYRSGTGDQVKLCPSTEPDGGYEFVPKPGIDE